MKLFEKHIFANFLKLSLLASSLIRQLILVITELLQQKNIRGKIHYENAILPTVLFTAVYTFEYHPKG